MREAVKRGFGVGAIKTGRVSGHGRTIEPVRATDSRRLLEAGASPVLFWSERGIRDETSGSAVSIPLPARDDFCRRWSTYLSVGMRAAFETCDLVVVEGRPIEGALIVQMERIGAHTARKYPTLDTNYVIRSPDEIDQAVSSLLEKEIVYARKKDNTRRKT